MPILSVVHYPDFVSIILLYMPLLPIRSRDVTFLSTFDSFWPLLRYLDVSFLRYSLWDVSFWGMSVVLPVFWHMMSVFLRFFLSVWWRFRSIGVLSVVWYVSGFWFRFCGCGGARSFGRGCGEGSAV